MKSVLVSCKVFGVTLLFFLMMTALSQAAIEGGDSKRGKELAIQKCKHCHITGAEGGTMTPLSKTQRQWERFYTKDKHNKLASGTWGQINQQELLDIMQFMYDHAADSPQPATCGQ